MTVRPTVRPVRLTVRPSDRSSVRPAVRPLVRPTVRPSVCPTVRPSDRPSVVVVGQIGITRVGAAGCSADAANRRAGLAPNPGRVFKLP